ncbi:class I SAM-dependent methyltransferase [Bacterioplanes sanyensis]|nr:class I SAM-dependent methyltransferase [Bacterioplanes sanyensis]
MSHWSDEHAHDYDERWGQLAFHQLIPQLANVRPGHRIVEIGCGGGFLSLCLAQSQPNVTVLALDPSAAMIERAHKRQQQAGIGPEQLSFALAGAEQLDVMPASQDLIVAAFSLHHWQQPEVAMTRLTQALKPGGRFWLCEDLNTPSFGDLDVHQQLKMLPGIEALLRDFGFRDITHRTHHTDEGDFLEVQGVRPVQELAL